MIQFDFAAAITEHGRKPLTGLVHVGACTGEEFSLYEQMSVPTVLWIEANPATYLQLCQRIQAAPHHQAVCALIADRDGEEVSFYVTSDPRNGADTRHASSSMLPLAEHRRYYPNITVTDVLTLPTRTLAGVLATIPAASRCNALVLDIQGAELKALQGAGDWLARFDYICTEVNTGELYAGCARLDEVDQHLRAYGFRRVVTKLEPQQWGDALYLKP